MKRLIISTILLFLLAETSWAQLSGAPFSSFQGTYVPITGGSVLGNTSTNDQVFVDPAVPLGATSSSNPGTTGPGFPIGFSFLFDGSVYDRFAVNANGWISLGQSALGSTAVWIVAATAPIPPTVANITPPQLVARVAGLGCNLAGQSGSELRIQTIGTAPNRECVIQWKGYRVNGQTGDNLNFQIRLIETTNQVRFIYGQMTKNATSVLAQVGMRDKPATMAINYAGRKLDPANPTNWANTVPGTTTSTTCILSQSVYPASGLTFVYDPIPPCTGTPNPGNTVSTSTLLCPGVNFTLSIQNFTPGYDVSYQWQSSLTGSDPWTNITSPALPHYAQITLNETETTWYRCMVTCSGNSTASNPIQVVVNTWLYCGFCAPTYTGGPPYVGPYVFDNINLVTLFPLTQATGVNVANNYYLQYVYTQNAVPDIARGQSFLLNMTFNTDTAQFFGVWIDFDHSSAFDADEYFSTGTNAGPGGIISFPILVPVDALTGQTRLRIRGGDNVALSANQACGTSNSITGCAQDYLVNIVETSTINGHVLDSGGNPVGGATVECTDRALTVTGEDGYYSLLVPSGSQQLKCYKSGYNTVVITPTIPPASTVNQDFTLTNPIMVVSPSSLFIALTSNGSINTNLEISNSGTGALDWDAKVNYNVNRATTFTYCAAGSFTCMFGNMYIAKVVLNSINNSSPCTTYSDFTSISTDLVPGESYTISITEGGTTTATDKIWVWIDYDQDGQFDENPVKLTGTPPNMSATFTVPQEVRVGSTRLRIRLVSDQDPIPCGSLNYGEVEDYTVNILSWLKPNSSFGTVAAGQTGTVPVLIDAARADNGNPGVPGQNYISELKISSTPFVGSITVPVTLAVTDPDLKAPESLEPYILNKDEGQFMLKWKYFTLRDGRFDHFMILRNGEIFGSSPVSSFEFALTEPGEYCFKVFAVYADGAYSEPSNEVCIVYPLAEGVPLAGWAIGIAVMLILGYTIFLIRRRI